MNGVSERTVRGQWDKARIFLFRIGGAGLPSSRVAVAPRNPPFM